MHVEHAQLDGSYIVIFIQLYSYLLSLVAIYFSETVRVSNCESWHHLLSMLAQIQMNMENGSID